MSDFNDAFEAGKKVEYLQRIGDLPVVALASGFALHDITKYLPALPAPVDKRGLVTLHTPEAFVAYVDAYRDADTLILTDVKAATVTAVIDYHHAGEGAPRHGKHRAGFACRPTPEWTTWTGAHKRPMPQAEFAQFVEDNLPDIASPAGAVLLDMARTLEVKKDVQFASSVRLTDGQQQLSYNETIDGTSGKGSMRIVEEIVLGLAPFEGSQKFEVRARLRFRLTDGRISLWVDLLRTHVVLQDAFADVVQAISTGLPDARIVAGSVARIAE